MYVYIYIHTYIFIHSLVIFVSITKVDNYEPPTRSLLRSSLHYYIFSQTYPIHNILHPHSSRCTNFSFSLHITLISVDELNHSNLSTYVLHISFSSSPYLPRSDTLFATALKFPHSLPCPSNLSSTSF